MTVRRWNSVWAVLVLSVVLPAAQATPTPAQTPTSPCTTSGALPTDASDALTADCDALWAFYNGLTNQGRLAAGAGVWGAGSPLAAWTGVEVTSGRVSGLDLEASGLEGTIGSELGNLDALVVLNLGSNGLTGAIPFQLGGLENLEELFLYQNGLTGGIPTQFSGLVNLRNLFLQENRLFGNEWGVGDLPGGVGIHQK